MCKFLFVTINLSCDNAIRVGFHKKINKLSWFEFYLSNKKLFFVFLGAVFAVPGILDYGVLQGWIGEPIFSLYVNDFPKTLA